MDPFVWNQSFATGQEALDEQLGSLVDLFNELGRALYRLQGPTPAVREPVLRDIFQRLLAYAEYHFADEEALMRRAGVDARHVAAHGAEHQQFLQQVRDLWSVRALLAAPASCFTSFLNGWLGLHILAMDQSLARQMAAVAQGTSAAEAYASEQDAHLQGAPMPLRLVERLYQGLSAQNDALLQAHLGLEARSRQCAQALERSQQELQQARAQLQALGHTDGALYISGRRPLEERLAHASASAFRQQQGLGVLVLAIDAFNDYSDHFGRQAADACFQVVARAVQGCLHRATDLLALPGGNELVLLLPDVDIAGACAVAERVVLQIAALALPNPAARTAGTAVYGFGTPAPTVTVSVGLTARVPRAQESSVQLLVNASAALRRAQAQGGNRWCLEN